MPEACTCSEGHKPVSSYCETSRSRVSMRRSGDSPKRILVRVAERIYESCVAFNLRYCSLQGIPTRSAIRNSIRDLFLLACFLIANAVVFFAIVCRAAVNVYAAVYHIIRAIKMRVTPKQDPNLRRLLRTDADYEVTSSDVIN